MRRPEQALQIAFINSLRASSPGVLAFHVPNGGKRTFREAQIFKALGVVSGIPDMVALWPIGRAGFIEFKASAKDDGTDIQKAMHMRLKAMGFPVAVCSSVDGALEALRGWGAPINAKVAA